MLETLEFTLEVRPMLREQFAEAFHTVLRKGLDTKFSVIAWNAISLCPPVVWRAFVEDFVKVLDRPSITFTQFKSFMVKWDADTYFFNRLGSADHEEWKDIEGKRRQLVSIFNAAMNCMPDADILVIMETLEYYTRDGH
jgi:hypothetical protein